MTAGALTDSTLTRWTLDKLLTFEMTYRLVKLRAENGVF